MHDTVSGSQTAAHRFPQTEASRRPTNDTTRPPCRPGEWQSKKGHKERTVRQHTYLVLDLIWGDLLSLRPLNSSHRISAMLVTPWCYGSRDHQTQTRRRPGLRLQSSVPPARTKALGTNARPNEPFPCVPAPVTNEPRQLGDGQRRPISFGGTTNWSDSGIRQLIALTARGRLPSRATQKGPV